MLPRRWCSTVKASRFGVTCRWSITRKRLFTHSCRIIRLRARGKGLVKRIVYDSWRRLYRWQITWVVAELSNRANGLLSKHGGKSLRDLAYAVQNLRMKSSAVRSARVGLEHGGDDRSRTGVITVSALCSKVEAREVPEPQTLERNRRAGSGSCDRPYKSRSHTTVRQGSRDQSRTRRLGRPKSCIRLLALRAKGQGRGLRRKGQLVESVVLRMCWREVSVRLHVEHNLAVNRLERYGKRYKNAVPLPLVRFVANPTLGNSEIQACWLERWSRVARMRLEDIRARYPECRREDSSFEHARAHRAASVSTYVDNDFFAVVHIRSRMERHQPQQWPRGPV